MVGDRLLDVDDKVIIESVKPIESSQKDWGAVIITTKKITTKKEKKCRNI
jgi:hypothetical protein